MLYRANDYKILGIPRHASISEIKEAFRTEAKKHHPDKGGNTNVFIQLKEAYEKVMNEKKKDPQYSDIRPVRNQPIYCSLLKRFFAHVDNKFSESHYHWTA